MDIDGGQLVAIYYSESVGGFLDSDIWTELPNDVVAISKETHSYLLDGQKKGAKIVSSEGRPKLSFPPKPTEEEIKLRWAKNQQEKRNKYLRDSDWTQVADAPVDQAAWAVYRQGLRDITNQETFPSEVTWPAKPSE